MTRRPCFDRRAVLAGLAALALAPPARGAERLTLWGIPGTPSAVFARAVVSDRFQAAAPGARFEIWKSADQLRAGIASGAFRLFASSTCAAANFFNRGAGTRMVNVVTWGVLHVMARDDRIRSIADLAGRRVLLSNKNEAPDLLFRMVLGWAGLDPDRDLRLDYVGSPGEAVPLFLAGRGDVALLHEPAAKAAQIRAEREGLPMIRALDIAEIYGRHTGCGPRIPQVGLAVSAEFLDSARQAQEDIETYFQHLMALAPASSRTARPMPISTGARVTWRENALPPGSGALRALPCCWSFGRPGIASGGRWYCPVWPRRA